MLNIKTATKDDIEVLQILDEEGFISEEKYDIDLDMGWARSEKGQRYFSELLHDEESCCLIAEDDGKQIGYIAARKKDISYRLSKYIEIENMIVIPEYRSKGVGTLLMNECLNWAKNRGFQCVYVNAYFKNNGAIQFYKKNRFSEIDLGLERPL